MSMQGHEKEYIKRAALLFNYDAEIKNSGLMSGIKFAAGINDKPDIETEWIFINAEERKAIQELLTRRIIIAQALHLESEVKNETTCSMYNPVRADLFENKFAPENITAPLQPARPPV